MWGSGVGFSTVLGCDQIYFKYLLLRERASVGGTESEGVTESHAGPTLSAQSPARGSNS